MQRGVAKEDSAPYGARAEGARRKGRRRRNNGAGERSRSVFIAPLTGCGLGLAPRLPGNFGHLNTGAFTERRFVRESPRIDIFSIDPCRKPQGPRSVPFPFCAKEALGILQRTGSAVPVLPQEDPRWERLRSGVDPGVNLRDRYRGALIGEPMGDALGGTAGATSRAGIREQSA